MPPTPTEVAEACNLSCEESARRWAWMGIFEYSPKGPQCLCCDVAPMASHLETRRVLSFDSVPIPHLPKLGPTMKEIPNVYQHLSYRLGEKSCSLLWPLVCRCFPSGPCVWWRTGLWAHGTASALAPIYRAESSADERTGTPLIGVSLNVSPTF